MGEETHGFEAQAEQSQDFNSYCINLRQLVTPPPDVSVLASHKSEHHRVAKHIDEGKSLLFGYTDTGKDVFGKKKKHHW